jgi:arsenate reductase
METRLFGIQQCDQVRAARRWLDSRGLTYVFIDFKKEAPTEPLIQEWLKHLPFDSLLNKRGRTWRTLPEDRRRQIIDQPSALELMLGHPLVIKRPVLVTPDEKLAVGFSDSLYTSLFPQSP